MDNNDGLTEDDKIILCKGLCRLYRQAEKVLTPVEITHYYRMILFKLYLPTIVEAQRLGVDPPDFDSFLDVASDAGDIKSYLDVKRMLSIKQGKSFVTIIKW